MELGLQFDRLRNDATHPGDLDLLYQVVAGEFSIVVHDAIVYREIDFPVVELAFAITGWSRTGLTNAREFVFEPTGYQEPAFCFRPLASDWEIISSQHLAASRVVSTETLERSIEAFMQNTEVACADLGLDVLDLMRRLRQRPR